MGQISASVCPPLGSSGSVMKVLTSISWKIGLELALLCTCSQKQT